MPTAENEKDTQPQLPAGRSLDSVIAEHEGMPLWLQNAFEGVKKYQNVIYAVLTVVLLAWAIVRFRAKQAEDRLEEAWFELDQAQSPEALKALAEKNDDLDVAPLIHLRLGRALLEDKRFDEAIAELEATSRRWPETMAGKLARSLATTASENKAWDGKDGLLEKKLEELRKLKAEEIASRAPKGPAIDDRALPLVELETAGGKIMIELDEETAPNAVAAFVRNIERGMYLKTCAWKVEPDAGVFLGDVLPDGTSPPGARIAFESSALGNGGARAGLVALVRDLPAEGTPDTDALRNSASFRFVILTVDAPRYDGRFLVVGRVTEGLDVAKKLAHKDLLTGAKVTRKRSHPYEPKELSAAPEAPK